MSRSKTSLRQVLRRHWRRQKNLYLPLILFAGIGGGLFIFIRHTRPPEVSEEILAAARTSTSATERTLERYARGEPMDIEKVPLPELIEAILAAYGGRDLAATLTTIERRSLLHAPEVPNALEIVSHWKYPDLTRYTIQFDRFALRSAYNGEIISESRLRHGTPLVTRNLTGTEREQFLRNAAIAQPEVVALRETNRFRLAGSSEVDGRPCFILVRSHRGYEEKFYFDQASLLCLKRERFDSDLFEEGSQHIVLRHSNFRSFGGLLFHTNQHLYSDGKLINRIVTEEIRLNPGLLSDAFNPPALAEN